MEPNQKDQTIKTIKQHRLDLDGVLQRIRVGYRSRETSLAITKLQEAIMWLGMSLREINNDVSCYKEGYNPENAVVEPVADGIQL
jgi:hypothetical protein